MHPALLLPRSVFEALLAHGEQTYPQECCGVLLGLPGPAGWRIVQALPAVNATSGAPRNRFEIAPAELVRILRQGRRQNLEIAGFYHSHPDHPAAWSPTDLAGAHWLGCSYLILEVAQGRAATLHSFRLAGASEEEKRFEPEPIVIEDESSGSPGESARRGL